MRQFALSLWSLLTLALLIAPFSAAPAPLAAAPGRSVFGVNSHLGSRHGDIAVIDEALGLLEGTEAGWLREEFQWGLIDPERSGNYPAGRWDLLDKVIAEETKQGFNIIGLLNDAPGTAPPDTAGFVRFVRDTVRRYPQIRYWEVWNEPENSIYWPNPDPAAYTALLKAVSQAIKEENSSAQVISAGIVPTHADFLRGIYANGGWNAFDIVGLHPYVDPYTPESGQIGDGGDVSKMSALVAQFGAKPIWATEYGWSTGQADRLAGGGSPVDADTQANYLVRGAALLRAAGVDRIIWYKFKDEGERDRYGMVDLGSGQTDYSQPKPAYTAFRTLNQQLADSTSAEALTIGQARVVLDFEQPLTWKPGPAMGTLSHSSAQSHGGSSAGALSYNFDNSAAGGNDWVGFTPPEEISLPGAPTRLGIWVYGNGSGHELKVWLRDANNEVLQYRLGIIGAGGWRFVATPINGPVAEWNQMRDFGTPGNGVLDLPARFVAFVYDDNPNSETGSGTIYIDDLTALSSAQGVRFQGAGEVVDVLWAIGSEQIDLSTVSAQGTLTDRSGRSSTLTADGGQFSISLGESPVYVRHGGGQQRLPEAPPAPVAAPTAAPDTPRPAGRQSECRSEPDVVGQSSPRGSCQFFAETGYQVCGRLLEYWQQNDGLRVFGYPITPQRQERIEGGVYEVQWFQRNRLELHPENSAPYDVLLGRLGAEQSSCAQQSEAAARTLEGTCYRIPGAAYDLCEPFLSAWRANGLELDGRPGTGENESLALFGLPLGPPHSELIEGKPYTVQWFERSRFEWHPENSPPYDVLYGLLGNESQP